MSIKSNNKESTVLKETVDELLKVSRESSSVFWRDVAKRINSRRKSYANVNVGKIDKIARDGDIIVVPGSLLGSGYFERKVTIAALRASRGAIQKLSESGAEFKSLVDVAHENPKGTGIRIVG